MGVIATRSATINEFRRDIAAWPATIGVRTGFHLNVTLVLVLAVFAVGALVMLGAMTNSEEIVQIAPGLAPMQFNTALLFSLSAVALITRKHNRRVSIVCAAFVVLVSAATLFEYVTSIDFGLDDLVVGSDIKERTSHPGRMSQGTALAFVLTGAAIVLSAIRLPIRIRRLVLEISGLMLCAAAFEGLFTYLFPTDGTIFWHAFSGMAVHTSLCFLGIAVAIADLAWQSRSFSRGAAPPVWLQGVALMIATIFDLYTPAGMIGGIAYIPVVFLAGRYGSVSSTFRIAIACTFLAILGFVWSPGADVSMGQALFNRTGEIAAIWVVAVLQSSVGRKTRELKNSEERHALAANAAKVGLWDQRMDGEQYWWSPVMYRLLGYRPGEIEASRRSLAERLHPEDRQSQKDAFISHLIKRTPYEIEFRLRHRSLGYRWFLCSGQAVWSRTGKPLRMTGTLMDIDDRKRAERQRNETQWVATVSHELRTPMTSCIGALALVRSEHYGALPVPVANLLDMAQSNGERLVKLVDDLLVIQTLNAGHFEMKIEVVSAKALVEIARDAMSGVPLRRGVTIVSQHCIGDPRIRVDSDRLVQVLTNFLSNALKYAPDESTVEISTEWVDKSVRISVKDEGPGIPEVDQYRIFEKFFRVDADSHRQSTGTGLGLSISKSIIESMGGQIGFQSEPGRGATFFADLPLVTWGDDYSTSDADGPEPASLDAAPLVEAM